jgi:3'-phosphoadenosine 5'-phosphosulfate sulfotransferase (PAPS reductase)/FAD synthetase
MALFQDNAKMLRLGYTPGIIRHYFHGSKKNRNYTERWKILMAHKYSPIEHLTYDDIGILIPRKNLSLDFITDIYNYFLERKPYTF